jgi:hypothetical protein
MAITIIGVSLQMAQPASSPMGGMSMATVNRTAPFDRQFIDMMVPHHQGAVAMAHIALTRAQHPQIKWPARSIIAAQEAEIRQMTAWRKAWYGSATTRIPAQRGAGSDSSGARPSWAAATRAWACPWPHVPCTFPCHVRWGYSKIPCVAFRPTTSWGWG